MRDGIASKAIRVDLGMIVIIMSIGQIDMVR